MAAGAATVVNEGPISGTGDSVLLHAGGANRVVVYQGAVFHGVMDGGNPIGGAAISTLELGFTSGVGTLSGLGSQYVDFAQITVDHGADWMARCIRPRNHQLRRNAWGGKAQRIPPSSDDACVTESAALRSP